MRRIETSPASNQRLRCRLYATWKWAARGVRIIAGLGLSTPTPGCLMLAVGGKGDGCKSLDGWSSADFRYASGMRPDGRALSGQHIAEIVSGRPAAARALRSRWCPPRAAPRGAGEAATELVALSRIAAGAAA